MFSFSFFVCAIGVSSSEMLLCKRLNKTTIFIMFYVFKQRKSFHINQIVDRFERNYKQTDSAVKQKEESELRISFTYWP